MTLKLSIHGVGRPPDAMTHVVLNFAFLVKIMRSFGAVAKTKQHQHITRNDFLSAHEAYGGGRSLLAFERAKVDYDHDVVQTVVSLKTFLTPKTFIISITRILNSKCRLCLALVT